MQLLFLLIRGRDQIISLPAAEASRALLTK
jgi:hypothetical protein